MAETKKDKVPGLAEDTETLKLAVSTLEREVVQKTKELEGLTNTLELNKRLLNYTTQLKANGEEEKDA